MNSIGERPSPCGEPIDVLNSAECVDFMRTFSLVSVSSSLTKRNSSSLQSSPLGGAHRESLPV